MDDNCYIHDEIDLLKEDAKIQAASGHNIIANRYEQIITWLEELCVLREKHEMLNAICSLRGANIWRSCDKEQISDWLTELYNKKLEQDWRQDET